MKVFIQKVGEEEKLEFTPFFMRLFLPVNQWILTELMDDWRRECYKKVSRETFIQFKNLSKDFLTGIKGDNSYDLIWVESIIYVSMHLMSRNLQTGESMPWINYLSNNSLSSVDINLFVLRKIKELYQNWLPVDDQKVDKLAQPFAFYLLVSSIANDNNIITAIKGAKKDMDLIDDYLNCRSTGVSDFPNRLTLFVVEFFQNGNKIIAENDQIGLNNTGHFELLNINKVKIDRIINDNQKINILAMGIPGSGKSTIIKMVRHVLSAPKNNRINTSMFSLPITALSVVEDENEGAGENINFFGSLTNRTKATINETKEFPGEIRIGDSNFSMAFFDTKGGIMVQTPLKYDLNIKTEDIKRKLEKLMTETDLLLVILDPETVFYKDDENLAFENILQFIATRLDYLFHKSQHAMIALVFAKFDEYGTIIKGPRNLIHNDAQIKSLKRFIENNTEANWDFLIKEISKSYILYGKSNSLKDTIIQLLERIKFLLTAICSTKKHPVVNCYIASSAIIKDIKDSIWTGYPEIFSDFANYMDWLIKKKQAQKFDGPTFLSASITDNFKVELKWLNPNSRELYSIIMKKNSSDNFIAVGKATPIKPNIVDSFVDNFVEHNISYSYKIIFIDSLEDQNLSKHSSEVSIIVPPKPSPLILPPTNFQCRFNNKEGRVLLEWSNENNIDVLNRLERRENDGEFKSVFERPQGGSSESYSDGSVESGKTYFYRIASLESQNLLNTSRFAEASPARTAPNSIKLIKCEIKPNVDQPEYIEVFWQESKNFYEIEYLIKRKITDLNGTDSFLEIADNYKNFSYKDSNIKRGQSYQYQIITREPNTKLDSLPVNSEKVLVKKKDITPYVIVILLIIVLVAVLLYTFLA